MTEQEAIAWHPMIAAPKDGTHILVYDRVEDVITSVWWGEGTECWMTSDPNFYRAHLADPVCWQHMPRKPAVHQIETEQVDRAV